MIGYIYQIINNENQKVYVGKTINFTQPFKEDENEIKSMLEFPTDINIVLRCHELYKDSNSVYFPELSTKVKVSYLMSIYLLLFT